MCTEPASVNNVLSLLHVTCLPVNANVSVRVTQRHTLTRGDSAVILTQHNGLRVNLAKYGQPCGVENKLLMLNTESAVKLFRAVSNNRQHPTRACLTPYAVQDLKTAFRAARTIL